jgi:hypothetical protein
MFFAEGPAPAKDTSAWRIHHGLKRLPKHSTGKEVARRRDEALKRALNTPPTPHKPKKPVIKKTGRKPKDSR